MQRLCTTTAWTGIDSKSRVIAAAEATTIVRVAEKAKLAVAMDIELVRF